MLAPIPNKSDLQRAGDLWICKDCRALQAYHVSIVAFVSQSLGMGQLNDAISSIAVIILMHLFRDSVDKAKFWLYAERVTL